MTVHFLGQKTERRKRKDASQHDLARARWVSVCRGSSQHKNLKKEKSEEHAEWQTEATSYDDEREAASYPLWAGAPAGIFLRHCTGKRNALCGTKCQQPFILLHNWLHDPGAAAEQWFDRHGLGTRELSVLRCRGQQHGSDDGKGSRTLRLLEKVFLPHLRRLQGCL